MNQSASNMSRSTAEALKQIQKQGLSISIIGADSPKTFSSETGSKETRAKQIAVVSETLPNISRSGSSTENKPSISQARLISNAPVETRSSTTQSALSANQTVQSGAIKLSPVSSTSDIKLPSSQKVNNPNSIENKNQFPTSNRTVSVEKNQTNLARQNTSNIDNKVQINRNVIPNIAASVEIKTPNRNNPVEAKTLIVQGRTHNQNLVADSKPSSTPSRLPSVLLEGKTNSNPSRVSSQNNSTPVLDKSTGQRNQLLVTELKTPSNQCKNILPKQSDIKNFLTPKSHQNVKIISTPRVISQFHPNAVRISGVNNNGKANANKSSVNTLSEQFSPNPFRIASTLTKNAPAEKSAVKGTKCASIATTVSETQSVQSKTSQISMKSENRSDNQCVKISELSPELLQKPISRENSSEALSSGVNIMPRAPVKRVALATSTPVSANKRKCVKVSPSSASEQSAGSQSDINTLSSDESPQKEKKVFNLRGLTPGLTITPVHAPASTPSTSTQGKKIVEPNQNIIVICPLCKQCSYNLTQCDSCHEKFASTPVRYQLKNTQIDSPSIVVTQNVTTSIEKSMKIVYHLQSGVSPNQSFKFQQAQQVIKVSPRGRGRPKRRYIEPVCYTLSSDDEEAAAALPYEPIPDDINSQIMYANELEENHDSEHSSNSDMMPEENTDFGDSQYPGVTSIKGQFSSNQMMNNSMEDEEEEELEDEEMEPGLESEEEDLGVEQPEFDEEDEELEEEEEEEEIPIEEEKGRFVAPEQYSKMLRVTKKTVIKCRSIRIGSYKIHPDNLPLKLPYIEVVFTDKSMSFFAPLVTEGKKCVQLTLMAVDAEQMWIHFGKCLPIIFVKTSANYADYVKRMLNMNKSHDLFIPKSEDLKKNKLTFLIDTLNEEQKNFMRFVFPGPEKLIELDQKEANEILVKSTPSNNFIKVNCQDAAQSPPTTVTVSGVSSGLCAQALTITKVTKPVGPVIKLLTYPPPPQTGGIAINTADLATLEEGEFLNDAILDFFLKYVFYEKLSSKDREKTHIFSSFFYPRLTQKPDRARPGEEVLKTVQMRRHNQVKTWTKNVDIFSKDYIVIPVNQHNHWFLAFVCYPGHIPDATVEKVEPKTNKISDSINTSNENSTNKVIIQEETINNEDNLSQNDSANSDSFYEVEEPPDSDEEDSSELPERSINSSVTFFESGGQRKETPCILIFDSLSGPNRTRIASTLREYLEVEWKIRKGTRKIFDKNTIQGFIMKCPQQTNFSDCGLYVLQYVESFFENPIPYFGNPMPDLINWFSDAKISRKRQEIKELILSLQKKYQTKPVLSGVTIKKVNTPAVSPAVVSSTQPDNR